MRLEFSESVRELLDSEQDLEIPVDWTSEAHALDTYLDRGFGNSYDFRQAK